MATLDTASPACGIRCKQLGESQRPRMTWDLQRSFSKGTFSVFWCVPSRYNLVIRYVFSIVVFPTINLAFAICFLVTYSSSIFLFEYGCWTIATFFPTKAEIPRGYVVDFYDGQQATTHPVSIHIDARPEVSIQGLQDRLWRWWKGWPALASHRDPRISTTALCQCGGVSCLCIACRSWQAVVKKDLLQRHSFTDCCWYVTEGKEVEWYLYIYILYLDSDNTTFVLQTSLSFYVKLSDPEIKNVIVGGFGCRVDRVNAHQFQLRTLTISRGAGEKSKRWSSIARILNKPVECNKVVEAHVFLESVVWHIWHIWQVKNPLLKWRVVWQTQPFWIPF